MSVNGSSARSFIPVANKYDRVILLVDMDCFYCQVEEKLDPSLKGKPLAVVQYNAWRGGGIIAVNYPARAKGVTRHMRGDEAKEQCPEIQLVKVPNVREKADLTKYREAGKDVANVLQRFTPLLERASVDEAYLDITEAVNKRLQEMNDGTFVLQPKELVNTYVVGFPTIGEFVTKITSSFISNPMPDDELYRNFHENDIPVVRQSNIRLLIGASIASEIRNAVKAETLYECSAGIAHNKILAKLACGLNKPNKQTILPLDEITNLFETLPISKIKGLGAKFGEEICQKLKVRNLGQLLKFSEIELQKKFDEKNGTWLYNICRGIDLEAVTPRFYSKSIGSCKKFPGRNNITGLKTLQHWLKELASEIIERLEKDILENNRRAKQMVVNFVQEFDGEEILSSRSALLQCYDTETLAKTSFEIIKANTKQFFRSNSESVLNNPIKFLGISVGKFETISNSQNNIQEMFAQQASKKQNTKLEVDVERNFSCNKISVKVGTKTQEPEQTLGFQNGDISKETIKDKNSRSVKSFFLNVLRESSQNSSATLADNNMNKSNETTRDNIFALHTENSPKPENDKLTSHTNNDNSTRMSEKSLFANELQNKEGKLKTTASDEFTINNLLELNTKDEIKTQDDKRKNLFTRTLKNKEEISKTTTIEVSLNNIDVTKGLNEKENVETKDSNSNELSNLTIQNGESELITNNSSNNTFKKADMENHFADSSNVSTLEIILPSDLVANKKRKFDEISSNEIETDYRQQYAEFAVPKLRLELLQFTDCSKCGIKIFNDPNSIQTHHDLHFAQELNEQQRNEFKNEIRKKINSTKLSPNNKNNKKLKKVQVLNSTIKQSFKADITKFLIPQTTDTSSVLNSDEKKGSEYNTLNIEICGICKTPIRLEDILEHKDFHIAKDLQRQLNKLEVHTVTVKKKPSSELLRKNMNTSLNIASQQSKANAKPITKFFTQSNL